MKKIYIRKTIIALAILIAMDRIQEKARKLFRINKNKEMVYSNKNS
ncbi:MAG: hypothetical protein HY755_11640 [Nitrospirae bacterium]|nr:hypothetical protein [Nitrospirota bacterium]